MHSSIPLPTFSLPQPAVFASTEHARFVLSAEGYAASVVLPGAALGVVTSIVAAFETVEIPEAPEAIEMMMRKLRSCIMKVLFYG